jgi:hypothetical protein
MINYEKILIINYSQKAWSYTGNTYEGLVWLDNSPKPTQAELEALWESTEEFISSQSHVDKRAPEYPSLADLADAMYWASKGDNTKLDNYYAACEAVKLKYPKS